MGSALAALGMKYSRPPSLLRSSSVPVSCVMGWLLGAAVLLPFSHSLYSILLVGRTDGRSLQMDSTAPFSGMDLRCGRTDATVGRITWSVDVLWACGVGGGDDQKDQRTMKTLGRDIVGGSLSLSLSWSSLPLYGFVSSALLPTAILREYGGLARRYRSHVHSRRPGLVYPEAI